MTDPLPGRVARELEHQAEALADRVRRSAMYLHEPSEFALAVRSYGALYATLGIAEDLGTMTTVESRNVVRRVTLSSGTGAVLKIVGNIREPGEGELLTAWHGAGLPCVEPLDWGYHREADLGTAMYLLTRLEPGASSELGGGGATADDGVWLHEVTDLVDLVSQFHRVHVRVSRARRWVDRVGQHLSWTLPRLEGSGLTPPPGWRAKLQRLSDDGATHVHGDPAGRNVLWTARGRLLLDPPGAYIALPEADVAQICSQVAGVEHVQAAISFICDEHRHLDPEAVSALAGLNFLIWAGYAAGSRDNPDVGTTSMEVAERHLKMATSLLHTYQEV